jgi:diguanylate cyclase (GGDEF)-like protein
MKTEPLEIHELDAQRLQRAIQEMNALYEVSCAMRTTLELNHIMYIILTGVTSHSGLGYNRAILYLLNERSNSMECRMVIAPDSGEQANRIWQYISESEPTLHELISVENIPQAVTNSSLFQSLKNLTFPVQEGTNSLLAKAYQRAGPWHIPPEEIGQYANDPLLQKFKTSELVIMPLKAKDKVNGLIISDNIYTKKPITENDIKIFTMLANQAGLAIENSELYEKVVLKSRTDGLTNLWNHAYFQEKLAEEVQRAQANHTSLSLTMIDIDDFKKLNDSLGHQTGDVILREIAYILNSHSRNTDYVCRYGGEEFAIILPQTSPQHGHDIAERLRSHIEQFSFCNDRKLRLTVSIGIAHSPEHGTSKEGLIAQADKAMYIAKFSGKNRTCIASTVNPAV